MGAIETFLPAPSPAERKEWLEEGALHAEVELERRAALPPTRRASRVLPSLPDGGWLALETSPLYEAGASSPITTVFSETEVMGTRALGRASATSFISIEWVPTLDVATRQSQLKLFQQMLDDVETGVADWGPKSPGVETSRAPDKPKDAVLGVARCLDIKTRYAKRSRESLGGPRDRGQLEPHWLIGARPSICEPAAFDITRCPTSEASEPTGSGYAVATGVGSAAGAAVAHLVHRHGRPNPGGFEAGAALGDPIPW